MIFLKRRIVLFMLLFLGCTALNAQKPWISTEINYKFYHLLDTLYSQNGGNGWQVKSLTDLLARKTAPYATSLYDINFARQDQDNAIQGGRPRYIIDTLDLSNNGLSGVLKKNAIWQYNLDIGGYKTMSGRFHGKSVLRFSYNNLTEIKANVWGGKLSVHNEALYFDHNNLTLFLPPREERKGNGLGLNGAEHLRLNNNKISDIPDEWYSWAGRYVYMVPYSVKEFRLENNYLNYAQLIKLSEEIDKKRHFATPQFKPYPDYIENFYPQRPLGADVDEKHDDSGTQQSVSFSLQHNDNVYQWELNGKLVPLTDKDYTFTLTEETAGVYRCHVTNPNKPGTYLESTDRAIFLNKSGNNSVTDFNLSNSKVIPNYPSVSVIGIFTGTDPDGDQLYYRMKNCEGDNSCFRIKNGNTLYSSTTLFEYDYKTEYTIQVEAYDIYGGRLEKEFVIGIGESSGEPVPVGMTLSNNTVVENEVVEIGKFNLEGVETGEYAFSFMGENDNNYFILEGNVLKTKKGLNYESEKVFNILVKASKGDIFITKSFTIEVENANDVPNKLAITNNKVAINQSAGIFIGYLVGFDEEDEDVYMSYAINGNEDFVIKDNMLLAKRKFSTSDIGKYEILIDVTSRRAKAYVKGSKAYIKYVDPKTATLPVTIEIYEKQVGDDKVLLSAKSIVENYTGLVGKLTCTTTESGVFELVDGEGSAYNNRFHISGSELFIDSAFDSEVTDNISIRVKYGSVVTIIHISIVDIDETPTAIGLSNFILVHNWSVGTQVATLFMKDPDAGFGTFEITGGDGSEYLSVNNQVLEIAKELSTDKTKYTLTIKATDIGGNNISADIELYILSDTESGNQTAIAVNGKSSLSVYPNPVRDNLNVDLTELEGDVQIYIYDLSGNLVYKKRVESGQLNNIDISGLRSGVYIMKANSRDVNYSMQIIKM